MANGKQGVLVKVLIALGTFLICNTIVSWRNMAVLDDQHLSLEDAVRSLSQRKFELEREITALERNKHRSELQQEKLEFKVRDLLPLSKNRLNLPHIFFITPTKRRPAQKADLIRLAQTLSFVPNLYWILVEDAEEPSPELTELVKNFKVNAVHLTALTPPEHKMSETDPNWKRPRGVVQRNTALQWIRTNFMKLKKGVVYFGDDDNVYDWALFDEIRNINKLGVWPVGLVGGRFVEGPILKDGRVFDFNAVWKKERPFPIDMAGFAVNVSIVIQRPDAEFSFDVPRGYQESHFLTALHLTRSDLEPKADFCTRVFVYHTRTEKVKLSKADLARFEAKNLTDLEKNAVV